jgi:hypothetical protein
VELAIDIVGLYLQSPPNEVAVQQQFVDVVAAFIWLFRDVIEMQCGGTIAVALNVLPSQVVEPLGPLNNLLVNARFE